MLVDGCGCVGVGIELLELTIPHCGSMQFQNGIGIISKLHRTVMIFAIRMARITKNWNQSFCNCQNCDFLYSNCIKLHRIALIFMQALDDQMWFLQFCNTRIT